MTSVILLALGIIIGVPLGALWCARRRDQAPVELPAHEHLWDAWELYEKQPVYKGDGRPVYFDMVQHRACHTCGFAEYHTDRL